MFYKKLDCNLTWLKQTEKDWKMWHVIKNVTWQNLLPESDKTYFGRIVLTHSIETFEQSLERYLTFNRNLIWKWFLMTSEFRAVQKWRHASHPMISKGVKDFVTRCRNTCVTIDGGSKLLCKFTYGIKLTILLIKQIIN